MAAIRFGIDRALPAALSPHGLVGVAALVVVNLLSVTLPLLVRGVIDDLQDGFTFADVLRHAGADRAAGLRDGRVRLCSRACWCSVWAARWRPTSSSRSLITCCARNRAGCRSPAAVR